jgi:hypothetical protein
MLRRMIVTRTTSALWQVQGHDLSMIGGEDIETRDAELFGGVGFASRPNTSDDVEAIVAFPAGGSGGPMILAARQEARRQIVAADLEAEETQIHNSSSSTPAIVRVKADGTVEARSFAGVALPLATKADLDALADYVSEQFASTGTGHTHTLASGGTVTLTTVEAAAPGVAPGIPEAAGTSVLKGE